MDKTYIARWNNLTECYECREWHSLDGNEWFTQNGELVDTPEFKGTPILLVGGPRDEDVVG